MEHSTMHAWDVDPKEARKIQESLRDSLVQKPLPKRIRYVAGADVSFNKYEKDVYAGIIVLSFPDLAVVEYSCIKMEVDFPYIPGFLSFREILPLMRAWEGITIKPDVVVVDGHGIAHPRRLGIAAHFGLVAGVPTIGAAKKLLYGTYEEPALEKGSESPIIDPKNGERLGTALRTKTKVKPMLISSGNNCDIASSIKIIKETDTGYRLPEPTRQAHELVNRFRRGELPVLHALVDPALSQKTLGI
jgi:deoxyribonuclease V